MNEHIQQQTTYTAKTDLLARIGASLKLDTTSMRGYTLASMTTITEYNAERDEYTATCTILWKNNRRKNIGEDTNTICSVVIP